MHSLKLGGLEFNPSHTVNEHRPKNFTLPDITLEPSSSNETFDLTLLQAAQSLKTDLQTTNNHSDHGSLEEVSVRPNLSDDMWNEDLWMDVVFKEMHDPKHRHPRHHGK